MGYLYPSTACAAYEAGVIIDIQDNNAVNETELQLPFISGAVTHRPADRVMLHCTVINWHHTLPSSCICSQIADTYSIVCKTQKKKPMENNGSKTLPRSFGGERNAGSRGRGRGVQGPARSQEEPCYEPVGDRSWSTCAMAEPDPAYATIDTHRKCEQAGTNNNTVGGNVTLKRKKQAPQQQAAPVAPQGSGPTAMSVRGLPGGENFYETISDVKQGATSSSTTTIFTFNDGMEMYVTGL